MCVGSPAVGPAVADTLRPGSGLNGSVPLFAPRHHDRAELSETENAELKVAASFDEGFGFQSLLFTVHERITSWPRAELKTTVLLDQSED